MRSVTTGVRWSPSAEADTCVAALSVPPDEDSQAILRLAGGVWTISPVGDVPVIVDQEPVTAGLPLAPGAALALAGTELFFAPRDRWVDSILPPPSPASGQPAGPAYVLNLPRKRTVPIWLIATASLLVLAAMVYFLVRKP